MNNNIYTHDDGLDDEIIEPSTPDSKQESEAGLRSIINSNTGPERGVTIEDVRKVIDNLKDAGFISEVEALLKAYSSKTVEDVNPSCYPMIYDDAMNIGGGNA